MFEQINIGATVGIIGGIVGTLFGLNGTLIGILASKNYPEYKKFILTNLLICTILGALSFVAGIATLLLGYPYFVWYPFLLLGVILSTVYGGLYPGFKRRDQQIE